VKSSPYNPSHTQEAYLLDMLDSAHAIRKYMEGVTYDTFWEDAEKRDAVTMRISVIGEAARFILPPTAAMLPEIPFPKIRAMRNHITHDYKGIDYTEVWNVILDHIPLLISELEGYFALHPIPAPVETGMDRIRAHSKTAIQKATPADSPPLPEAP
jgi:uncharacterized protein with HEPN domain